AEHEHHEDGKDQRELDERSAALASVPLSPQCSHHAPFHGGVIGNPRAAPECFERFLPASRRDVPAGGPAWRVTSNWSGLRSRKLSDRQLVTLGGIWSSV